MLRKILQRKQPNAPLNSRGNEAELSKELGLLQLIAIGTGTTIGAGIFILAGTVAREKTGPALPISFVIAGLAAALSALCYAELASRFPCAGSAYHYAHTCIGEGFAWLVGWALLLEYTVTGATAARGISPNLTHLYAHLGEKWHYHAKMVAHRNWMTQENMQYNGFEDPMQMRKQVNN